MILIDTSSWINHFRQRDMEVVEALRQERAVTCDVVLAELTLGAGIPEAVRTSLFRLPRVVEPTMGEVLAFIVAERRRLGLGVGVADVVVLRAAMGAGARHLTADTRLRETWRRWYATAGDPT